MAATIQNDRQSMAANQWPPQSKMTANQWPPNNGPHNLKWPPINGRHNPKWQTIHPLSPITFSFTNKPSKFHGQFVK